MTPLFMFWAPQFHFPWSGAVSQAIDPDIAWFSSMIRPGAGDPRVERRAFHVASYGKQLGLITDVLLEHVERSGGPDSESLRKLRLIRRQIDNIKEEEYGPVADTVVEQVVDVRERGGAELEELARKLIPLLGQARQTTEHAS